MLISTGPLVADSVRRIILLAPDVHDARVWTSDVDGRYSPVMNVAAHAAVLAGLVEWRGWCDCTPAGMGRFVHTDGGDAVTDEQWIPLGARALGIPIGLAWSLFSSWVSHDTAVRALTDIVNAVDHGTIEERIERTVWTIPFTGGRAYLRRRYSRT